MTLNLESRSVQRRIAVMTPVTVRFRALVREIIAEGRVPFPTELSQRMGWNGALNRISGRYVRIRTEELEDAGYVKGSNGKWTLP